MLHAIINGTASWGASRCIRMTPATAENAKPANPETTAPAKMALVSAR